MLVCFLVSDFEIDSITKRFWHFLVKIFVSRYFLEALLALLLWYMLDFILDEGLGGAYISGNWSDEMILIQLQNPHKLLQVEFKLCACFQSSHVVRIKCYLIDQLTNLHSISWFYFCLAVVAQFEWPLIQFTNQVDQWARTLHSHLRVQIDLVIKKSTFSATSKIEWLIFHLFF